MDKYKFGRLSVGVFMISLPCSYFAGKNLVSGDDYYGFIVVAIYTFLIMMLVGLVFGFIGMLRKEKSKGFHMAGIFLNGLSLIIVLLVFFTGV